MGRRLPVLLAIAVAAFLLIFQQGQITVNDGETMYQVTKSMADHGSLAIPSESGAARGDDGRLYSKYGIGLPVLALPPYLVGKAAAVVAGHTDRAEQAAVATLMPLIAGLLAAALFLLSRRLGASNRASVLVGAGAVLGTYALPYGKDYFAEPVTALFITLAFERVIARRPMTAGAMLAAACLTRPQSYILVLLVIPVIVGKQGVRGGLRAAIPIVVAGAVQVWLNVAHFGDPLEFGYGDEGFTNNVLSGLGHLLTSPAKSVILFAPLVLLLPPALILLWHRQRDAFVLLAANFLIILVMTAAWNSWEGGWSWGPRLLLPGVLPALAAVAVWLDARTINMRLGLAAVGVGFLLSASTLVVPTQAQQLDRPVPETGPSVTRQVVLIGSTASYTQDHALTSGAWDRTSGEHRKFINTWQVGAAREVGRKGLLGALFLSLVLLGVLVVATARLVQAGRPWRSPAGRTFPVRSPSATER